MSKMGSFRRVEWGKTISNLSFNIIPRSVWLLRWICIHSRMWVKKKRNQLASHWVPQRRDDYGLDEGHRHGMVKRVRFWVYSEEKTRRICWKVRWMNWERDESMMILRYYLPFANEGKMGGKADWGGWLANWDFCFGHYIGDAKWRWFLMKVETTIWSWG